MSEHQDLLELGEKLTTKGPHKLEGTPRRVRGMLGGKYVFDTLETKYVWEHPYYPYFYIPLSAFTPYTLTPTHPPTHPHPQKPYHLTTLTSGPYSTSRVLTFTSGSGALSNYIRIEFSALSSWFVEDEALRGPHPKDPYKRIDTLPSSREVRIEVNGTVVARSSQNVFLYETMLGPRYYLGAGGVEWGFLRESGTVSYCPYKGMANYYDVVVEGKEIKDAVWCYKYPTAESTLVAGRLCFYNEKVDVFVDGVEEK